MRSTGRKPSLDDLLYWQALGRAHARRAERQRRMLMGKRTYISAGLLAVLGALRGFGLVTPEQAAALEPILLAAGLAALRASAPK